MAIADREFHDAEQHVLEHEQAVQRLDRAIGAVAEGADSELDPTGELSQTRDDLRVYLVRLQNARRERTSAPSDLPLPSEAALARIQQAALAAPTQIGPTMLELSTLKGLLLARRRSASQAAEMQRQLISANAAADIADQVVEEAIQEALNRINAPLSRYYGQLVGRPVYSGLCLTYTQARAGGIEFEFSWDNRHDVCPPQRIMSESELNALGLALFLARLQTDQQRWRTMVLDDVVASFDAIHRTLLLRLLRSEFGDWQVILLTHDQQLSRAVGTEAPEWLTEKVTAWSDVEGPSFGSSSMAKRLRERLQAGEPAEELGGLARQAVEEAIERPVRKLGLKIRHDPTNGYTADEYRRALIEGLKNGGFPRAEDEILAQLGTDGSLTNRACHFRQHEPGVTGQDLQLLLEDLDALDRLFRCDVCDKKVWQVPHQGSSRCQCECGALTCA